MSIFFANKSASFEEVRARASKFASDRDWNQFHTPTNITLAMAGECGEVCEIFQFKGNLDTFDLHNNSNLSSSEIVHAGEEISDVLIYLTRLCTVCDIDLSACIQQKIEGSIVDAVKEDGTPTSPPPRANQVTKEWIDFPYSKIEKYTSNISKLKSKNPRYYCLKLQSHIGALCNLFARGEHFCDFNLTNWSIPELLEFSSLAATISLTMFSLAHILNLEVGTCIADKMDKVSSPFFFFFVTSTTLSLSFYHIYPSILISLTSLPICITSLLPIHIIAFYGKIKIHTYHSSHSRKKRTNANILLKWSKEVPKSITNIRTAIPKTHQQI